MELKNVKTYDEFVTEEIKQVKTVVKGHESGNAKEVIDGNILTDEEDAKMKKEKAEKEKKEAEKK
jgi:hypothetical protein